MPSVGCSRQTEGESNPGADSYFSGLTAPVKASPPELPKTALFPKEVAVPPARLIPVTFWSLARRQVRPREVV